MKKLLTLILGVVLLAGCAKKVAVHPGALNAADSKAYDTLIIAQAALNECKTQFGSVAEAKQPLDDAISAYDTAEVSYKLYHSTGSGDITALNAELQSVVAAIANLQKQFGSVPK